MAIFWLNLLLPFRVLASQDTAWIVIKPLAAKYHFASMQEAKLKVTVQGENGKPQYVLECYSFQAAPQTGEFMYSGDFECRFRSFGNKDREPTLFTELPNADKDWESRGRFLAEQLAPPCGNYKDLGRERSFRLRGFKVALKLLNVTFDDKQQSFSGMAPALKSFDLEVLVEQDLTATSAIASTPPLPRLGSLPKMCQKAFDTLYLNQFRTSKVIQTECQTYLDCAE